VNSLGKPPKIQLKGLTTIYAPVNEVDMTIIYLEYLNVKSPNGMIKATSKNIKDHAGYIPIILQKIVFTMAARIKPKTLLIQSYMHR